MKEIVINIPEYVYVDIQDRFKHPNKGEGISVLEDAVANGTSLPKGHGNLKDASVLRENYHTVFNDDLGIFEDVVNIADIDLAETLVEADKQQPVITHFKNSLQIF